MEDLSGGVKGLVMNDDLDKSAEERINMFFQFVKVCLQLFLRFLCCFPIPRIYADDFYQRQDTELLSI